MNIPGLPLFHSNEKQVAETLKQVGKTFGPDGKHKYVWLKKDTKASFKKMTEAVQQVLASKIDVTEKIEMLKGYKEITKAYHKKHHGFFDKVICYLFGQGLDVFKADSIIENGLKKYQIVTDSQGIIREGEFANGLLEGEGKMTFPNGGVQEGVFRKGHLHGLGKIKHDDGTIWEGIIRYSQLYSGKVITTDNIIYEGEFWTLGDESEYPQENVRKHPLMKGKPIDGEGTITFSDQTVAKGNFQEEYQKKYQRSMPIGL